MPGFGGAVKLTGESEYRKALNKITQNLKEVASEMAVVSAQFDKSDKSTAALSARSEALNKQLQEQQKKLAVLQAQYSAMTAEYAKQAEAHTRLVKEYETEKTRLEQIGKELGTTSKEYQEQQSKVADLAKQVTKSSQAQDTNATSLSKLRIQINGAQADCAKTSKEIEKLGDDTEEAGEQAREASGGFTVFKGVVADLAASAIKSAVAGIQKMGAALVNIGKQAYASYSQYEQLVGGVETLFGDSADVVQGYAEQAYQTAGLSANEYMETVTSFSASLIQSLGGDTEAAAKYADTAIRDMSDNANKMGTSMESLQYAYQGFAKQNYTMLDNLKLGYGGNKTEMERLIQDAERLDSTFQAARDENGKLTMSYADIVDAIHIVQTNMGIAGTTAAEASDTLAGSAGSMRAAWQNLITGIADPSQDLGKLIDNLVASVETAGKNMFPRIKSIIMGFGTAIPQILSTVIPQILEVIPPLLEELLPALMTTIQQIIQSLVDILPSLFPMIIDAILQLGGLLLESAPALLGVAVQLLSTIMAGISEALPAFFAMIPTILQELVTAIVENLPILMTAGIDMLQAIIDGFVETLPVLIEMLPDIVAQITQGLVDNFPALLEGAIKLFMALVEAIPVVVQALIEALPQILTAFMDTLLGPLGTSTSELWDNVVNWASGAWETIKGVWTAVTGWFNSTIIQPVKNFFSSMWDGLKNGASKAWEGIKGVFKPIADWFRNIFKKAWEGVKNVFSAGGKIFDGIKEGIANVFKTVVNALIKGINFVIAIPFNAINGFLRTLRNINILGIQPFGWISEFGVPQIPYLAKGGVLRRGQVGLLEGNGAEAVVPLEKNTEWIAKVAQEMTREIALHDRQLGAAIQGVGTNDKLIAAIQEAVNTREPVRIELTQPVYIGGKAVGNAVTELVVDNISSSQALKAAFVGV